MTESFTARVRPTEKTNPEVAKLEKVFSTENFEDTADAAKRIAWTIADLISSRGDKRITILSPSRGANSFIVTALRALREEPELSELGYADSIELPPLECFDSVREVIGNPNKEPLIRVLILPFTADATFDDQGKNERDVVAQMRESMTRVATELLFVDPSERSDDSFRLYLSFLEEVEGRRSLADFYKEFMPVEADEPVLMVDTAISGRASHNILQAFKKLNVDIGTEASNQLVPVIVVDNDGRRLNNHYRKWVDVLSKNTIKLKRIMSEDLGASVLGVVSVIYQNLITTATQFYECGDISPCFGSWHEVPTDQRQEYMDIFDRYINLITMKITGKDDGFEEARYSFLNDLVEGGYLKASDNMSMREIQEFFKRGLEVKKAYESRSHITTIVFDQQTVDGLLKRICRINTAGNAGK